MSESKPGKGDVLVVDDQPESLKVFTIMLNGQGYQVRTATSGQMALRVAQEAPPDLILLDVRMPDMDGYEVCERLKADERTGDIPIIFMSVMDQTHDKIRAFAAGGVDYVTKPLRAEELLARLETHLALRAMQKQLERKNAQLEQEIAERVRSEEERARAVEALRESEELLNNIVESMSDGILVLDSDFRHVYWNRAMERISKTPREDVINNEKIAWEIFPHLVEQGVDRLMQRAMQGEVVQREDIPYHLQNGTSGFTSEIFLPLRTSTGGIRGIVGVVRDTTERVRAEEERARAEEALRESAAWFRSVFEGSRDAVFITKDDSGFVDVNEAASRLTGYSREELLNMRIPDLHDVEDLHAYKAFFERIMAGESIASEAKIRRKDGTKVDTEFSNSRITIRGAPYVHTVARDITERVRAEEVRQQMEEQLRQQERLAAIGQLAGGIAHDFNNLLTSIILYAQIIKSDAHLPLNLASSAENILHESRRAAELVQQILDFSRRAMIETRPVDLTSFVEKTVGILRRTLPENVRLVLDGGVGGYVIRADPTRIQQVVMNLATNARDAMPDGGELRIGLARVEVRSDERPPVAEMPAGEWVCLAVSDTGTGMTEGVRSHLFEPFFTTKEVGKGTGLGLAQVHGIVKQHGGYIGVETAVGQGTTFHIYFPARQEKQGDEIAEEASVPPQGRGETILLVEDEEKLRGVGRNVLEHLGYRVVTAADGREALVAFRSAERVDLIITDVVMPEMGSKQLLRELRKVTPALKALAITGYAMQEDLQALREAGFVDIIRKPFDIDGLAQAVRRALDAD